MSANRCHARDGQGNRCTVEGEHTEIVNASGLRALSHETKTSWWNTPVSSITVVGGTKPRPEGLEQMIRTSREGKG